MSTSLKHQIDLRIEEVINNYQDSTGLEARYLLMNDNTYFELKVAYFKDETIASEVELDEYKGLQLFYNNFGYGILKAAS